MAASARCLDRERQAGHQGRSHLKDVGLRSGVNQPQSNKALWSGWLAQLPQGFPPPHSGEHPRAGPTGTPCCQVPADGKGGWTELQTDWGCDKAEAGERATEPQALQAKSIPSRQVSALLNFLAWSPHLLQRQPQDSSVLTLGKATAIPSTEPRALSPPQPGGPRESCSACAGDTEFGKGHTNHAVMVTRLSAVFFLNPREGSTRHA